MRIYDKALYYEIAFDYVNPKRQADLFQKFIARFSRIKVKRLLDIGCGPAVQLRELAKRGYECVGLDMSKAMLGYVNARAIEEHIRIETVMADARHFRLKRPVDFAFIMAGTINYLPKSNQNMLDHLDSVAASLRSGGLYVIENFWINPPKPEKWTGRKDGITASSHWDFKMTDYLNQRGMQYWTMKVNDHGRRYALHDINDRKVIMPQEFVALVRLNGKFESLGFFRHSGTKRMKRGGKDSDNNFVILRKR